MDADTSGTAPDQQVQQPAFITSASVTTFAGGSAAITILWKVAVELFGVSGRWFPGVVAALLGLIFFWDSVRAGNLSGPDYAKAFLVALVNACVALGCGGRDRSRVE